MTRLREGSALARLVARQSELHGADEKMRRVGREYPGLPDDLLNFHYNPLACALAAEWDGARVEELRLSAEFKDGVLTFPESPNGKPTRVVTSADGPCLEREWVEAPGRERGWPGEPASLAPLTPHARSGSLLA